MVIAEFLLGPTSSGILNSNAKKSIRGDHSLVSSLAEDHENCPPRVTARNSVRHGSDNHSCIREQYHLTDQESQDMFCAIYLNDNLLSTVNMQF